MRRPGDMMTVGTLATVFCLMAAAPAWAQRTRRGPTLPDPAPVNAAQKALDSAKKSLADAQDALSKAASELGAVKTKLLKDAHAAPELVSAKSEQDQADGVARTAKEKVLEALATAKPEYKAALVAKRDADARQQAAQSDPAAGPEDKARAWEVLLSASSVVAKFEADALDGDAGCRDALTNANTVGARVRDLQTKLEAAVKVDPARMAADAAVIDAQGKVESAKATLEAAAKDHAAAADKFKAAVANYKPPQIRDARGHVIDNPNPPAIILPDGWTSAN